MSTATTTRCQRDLRAILHIIRQGWTEEEHTRRRRIAQSKQELLCALIDGSQVRKRAS